MGALKLGKESPSKWEIWPGYDANRRHSLWHRPAGGSHVPVAPSPRSLHSLHSLSFAKPARAPSQFLLTRPQARAVAKAVKAVKAVEAVEAVEAVKCIRDPRAAHWSSNLQPPPHPNANPTLRIPCRSHRHSNLAQSIATRTRVTSPPPWPMAMAHGPWPMAHGPWLPWPYSAPSRARRCHPWVDLAGSAAR